MYHLYMHITPNNKKYIGITKLKPNERWKNGKGYKNNILFSRAINKYGWNNIQHIILLSNLTKEKAEQKEIEYIAKYQTTNNKYGYNIDKGGNTIGKMSDETKEKLRIAHKGKKQSEATKEKHRQATLKQWENKEFRNKMKSKRYKRGKSVICIETKKIFPRIKDASIYYNICDETIRKCCNKTRITAGGFHWAFYEEAF